MGHLTTLLGLQWLAEFYNEYEARRSYGVYATSLSSEMYP